MTATLITALTIALIAPLVIGAAVAWLEGHRATCVNIVVLLVFPWCLTTVLAVAVIGMLGQIAAEARRHASE